VVHVYLQSVGADTWRMKYYISCVVGLAVEYTCVAAVVVAAVVDNNIRQLYGGTDSCWLARGS